MLNYAANIIGRRPANFSIHKAKPIITVYLFNKIIPPDGESFHLSPSLPFPFIMDGWFWCKQDRRHAYIITGLWFFSKMSTYCNEERNGFEFVRWSYMNRKDVAKIKRYESGEQGKGYQRFSEARVLSAWVQRKWRIQC